MSSTGHAMTAALPSEKSYIAGHIVAFVGAGRASICFFLPWIAFVTNGNIVASLRGVQIGAGPTATLERLADALRPHLEVRIQRAADADTALRELVEGELLAARSEQRRGAFPCRAAPGAWPTAARPWT